jgi:folylpolyglutamate synthase/dihydropteroate synthase
MEYLVTNIKTMFLDACFGFVWGMPWNKDLKQCSNALLSILDKDASRSHLVEAAHARAESILKAEPSLKEIAQCNFEDGSIARQVQEARVLAQENNEILVVQGSGILMAEVREALGCQEPHDSDYIAEMAGAGIRQENFGNTLMEERDEGYA